MKTLYSYLIGFTLSLIFTGVAFWVVLLHLASIPLLLTLAVAQLAAQLVFFLHMGQRSTPTTHTAALLLAAFITLVVVGGSVWIMQNLQHVDLRHAFINGQITPETEND